ncbi:hypothetical protein Gotur_031726 [Gossypium turneri]
MKHSRDHDQVITITLPIPLSMVKWIIGMLWNDIGLYIAVNSVLALAAGYTTSKDRGGSGCWRWGYAYCTCCRWLCYWEQH